MGQDKKLDQIKGELKAAKSAAQKAEGARDIFLANMSHQLRTPINTMLGLNELILRECQDETIRDYAQDIKHAGNVLLALVSDILDFSTLEAGKLELTDDTYDVSSLLNDLINSVSGRIRKKKLELVLDIAQDMPYKLFGDVIHIRQIISNLLTNAVKYTEKGKIIFYIGWERKAGDEIAVTVSVKDTGVGIKEKDIPRIFGAFQQMDTIVANQNDKTGLGLAITKRLVEMMGGSLTVESAYGKGSVFSFTITQRVIDEKPLGDFRKQYEDSLRSNQEYHQKFIAPLGRILVVDDNTMNLAVAQGLLKYTRLQVDVASSGEECLELIKRKTYHLICLDHMMPMMDGVETLHAIRSLEGNPSANVPVIALTANAVAGAKGFYLKEGFQDYLPKPIDAGKFEDMLIEYLPKNVVYLSDFHDNSPGFDKDDTEMDLTLKESQLYSLGFNIQHGLKYMDGSRMLYGQVLKDFHAILQEKEEALKDFLKKGDMPGYAIIVHSLKGNARNVGADDLADEAFELEKMSKAGRLEDVTVRSPILFGKMQNIRNGLKIYLDSEDKTKEGKEQTDETQSMDVSEEAWKAALRKLADRLDDFDGESAKAQLRALKRYKRPESDQKMLRMCEKAVRDYAYDVALEILNTVL